ncbi:phage portal protein [bacterium]|nr:phage portal protein [bacterium]
MTRTGSLHRFRPLPAETMYLINQAISKEVVEDQVKVAIDMYHRKKSDNDPRADGYLAPREIDYYKYVQLSTDNRVLNAFGDEDMVFKLFNPQNYADSNGYCISVVEQAIIMITNHLNIEAYNANFFTHGYAARGILHLKGAVTQNTLASFRRQFYNTISGSTHAWRTPIVAGLDDVQWVPMSGSAREMEYINFNSHIMRAICAQFQIDPIEVGLDYLTTANGRASSQAKESGQFKITYSRERGLIPILMIVEDLFNQDILPSLDKELANKYKFKFVGYTDDTAMTDISLRQAQMTVFSSMNDLLHNEEKKPIEHTAANLPLNQSFWNLIEKNMTRGEIREFFFGDVGASKRPELQYIPADPAFLSWNQLMMTINAQQQQKQTQKEQAKQQQAMQEHQMQLQQSQDQREQEAHDAQLDQAKQEQANSVVRSQDSKSLQEMAKEYGATKAVNIGGKELKNPINVAAETEE